ncbi:hypothetical protein TALC_00370 [Thermoplasmatales archaeon BRNA1]|nr:hypothetical protein TALC_00370 [Thermoplasmatales archaeon BRNA1]
MSYKAVNGMRIHVGEDGNVPEQALLKRFREYYAEKQEEYDAVRFMAALSGERPAPPVNLAKRDYNNTADATIPLKCTPEQVAAWWVNPSCCDVEDIDCPGAPKTNVPREMSAAQKRNQGKIKVIASPLEEQMIRRELVMGFDRDDVSRISESRPVIHAKPMARSVTGTYSPSANKVTIDRDRGMDQGTIVHELSHQLRATDPSRKDVIVTANPDRDIEESCTVAEQQARSDVVDYNGYYAKVPVFDSKSHRWRDPTVAEARRMAEEDHMLFTEGRGKGLKGDAAIRSVKGHWGQSHIARLRMHSSMMAVNRMADQYGNVDRVSMAKPRTRKEAEERATMPITNASAGKPGVALANVPPKRKIGHRRDRVILDTNIISQGAGQGKEPQVTAIRIAHQKDKYLYTRAVDAELRKTTDPDKIEGIRKYITQHQKHMLSPPLPTKEELEAMPPGLNDDRYILSDAIKTKTDIIVTQDKTFRNQGKNFGPIIIGPEEYNARKSQIVQKKRH